MNCELLATCSALGYLEGDTYHKESDCLEGVKDLIRYLRHEDDSRDIRQQLGAAQILQNDLLPMVVQHHQDKALFDAVIRLMVNLTQPALLCFGKVPQDPVFRHHFLQVVSYLQGYKEAFANEKVFGVLSEKLYDLLQLDWEQRQEEDNLLIERILLLVRNILHVPADPDEEKKVDDDASIHDKVLWAIHMSGMDDLIKFLASSQTEQQWTLHVLEIVSLMFREQTAEVLASTGQSRSTKEKEKDTHELDLLRQREMAEKKSRNFHRGSRHSRFGGSYIVQGLKAIGDRDVVYHKALHNFKSYSHDTGKAIRKVPKRKQLAKETLEKRRSAINVRLFLKEFCIDFLESCYNRIMYLVKDNLIREKSEQHDETYYLWSMAFFMAFNRMYRFRAELVSETVSVRTFHFIDQNLTTYYEMMLMDKKEYTSWSRRMHLALKAYQEVLMTINEMDHAKDEVVRESSKVIKNNIFYLMEFRELFLTLFRKFDETKQPRSFLKDLVETTHLFLKMLEKFCKGKNNILVQKKKVKRKKKSKAHPQAHGAQARSPAELEKLWCSLSEQLSSCANNTEGVSEEVVPFDAASDIPVEEQRVEAMVKIQDALLANRGAEAVSLLRAAREVWPEGDVFGSPNLELEEELLLLKQILTVELPRQSPPEPEDTEELDNEVEDEEMASVQVSETEFNFMDYMKRFANCNVIKPYFLLLKNYMKNSSHTNHCIVKMLHRIAYDLKMDALLYQLSVFCLFNKIVSDPAASTYKEMVGLAKYILNKFFTLAATNHKAFVELLFWKNTNTIREMFEGYQKPIDGEGDGRKKPTKWTPAEEEELRNLYLRFKEVEDVDVIENIMAHLKQQKRTRKQIANHLVSMGLADSIKEFKRIRKGIGIVIWTEDQEMEVQRLFEEFQETDDVLGNILKNITVKRSRAKIVEKLISMGLVSDRKELHKKRKKKGKPAHMTEEEFLNECGVDAREGMLSDEEELSDDYDDDEDEDDDHDRELAEYKVQRRKKEEKMSKQEDRASTGGPSDRVLQGLVRVMHQEGLAGPVLWLQNCLNRTADNREEDGISPPVPIVPLTEENEDAMENEEFQKLLKKVGIRPPANEQESFWRIPSKLSPEQLRRLATCLVLREDLDVTQTSEAEKEQHHPQSDKCQQTPSEEPHQPSSDKQQQLPNDGQQQPSNDKQENQPSEEQRAEALRALMQARKKKRTPILQEDKVVEASTTVENKLEADNSDNEMRVEKKAASKRSRLVDSEDEDMEATAEAAESRNLDKAHAEPESDSEENLIPVKRKRPRIEEEEED
ncbi:protein timeless homolog [Protopterus annectens]|uniref:protein timeless homolog n=1 Tax=Protopterus annectens TaxID=7888 RepID=UPI001CF99BBF|nr:protein timeless homolog [Protopterus annectens]